MATRTYFNVNKRSHCFTSKTSNAATRPTVTTHKNMSDSCQKCSCRHHVAVPAVQQALPAVAARDPVPMVATQQSAPAQAVAAQPVAVVAGSDAPAIRPEGVAAGVNPIVEKPVPVTAAPSAAPQDAACVTVPLARAQEGTASATQMPTVAKKPKMAKTATLRDFVESLKKRDPEDVIANADWISCGNVWFSECRYISGDICQYDHMRRRVPIMELTAEHLESCNMVSLCGDMLCPVHLLISKLEPLVASYGHVLFTYNKNRVVLSQSDGVESIRYSIVPSFDDRLFKETDQVMDDLAPKRAQIRALCDTVLSKYGMVISVEDVYADLEKKAPNDWVVEVVLIDRTLISMREFTERFKDKMHATIFSTLFLTRSPTGLVDPTHIQNGVRLATSQAGSTQVFLHVPRNGRMTMDMLDMLFIDKVAARATHLLAMLDKEDKTVSQ